MGESLERTKVSMRGCGWFKAPSKEEREGDDMDLVGKKVKVGKWEKMKLVNDAGLTS